MLHRHDNPKRGHPTGGCREPLLASSVVHAQLARPRLITEANPKKLLARRIGKTREPLAGEGDRARRPWRVEQRHCRCISHPFHHERDGTAILPCGESLAGAGEQAGPVTAHSLEVEQEMARSRLTGDRLLDSEVGIEQVHETAAKHFHLFRRGFIESCRHNIRSTAEQEPARFPPIQP